MHEYDYSIDKIIHVETTNILKYDLSIWHSQRTVYTVSPHSSVVSSVHVGKSINAFRYSIHYVQPVQNIHILNSPRSQDASHPGCERWKDLTIDHGFFRIGWMKRTFFFRGWWRKITSVYKIENWKICFCCEIVIWHILVLVGFMENLRIVSL